MKKSKIFIISGILILIILIITLSPPQWKKKSEQAKEAAIYLENYYDNNEEYPLPTEFYDQFSKSLMYETYSKHHYILEYKTNKLYGDAFGTAYSYSDMFENHIRYYTSSCDTGKRCNWRDFQNVNLVNWGNSPIHNGDKPYSLISNRVDLLYNKDSNLKKIYTYSWRISFIEKDEGKTYLHKNISYDPDFYTLKQTNEKSSLIPTGKLGETLISYNLIYCENISTNNCNSPIYMEMPLEIYNPRK